MDEPVAFRAQMATVGGVTVVQCCECSGIAEGRVAARVAHTETCPARDPGFYHQVEDEAKEYGGSAGRKPVSATKTRRRKAA